MMKKIGQMNFSLDDYRLMEYNESIDCSFSLYGDEDDEVMSIENYYLFCKRFASAMGFAEKTIEEWFGDY